MIVPFIPPWTVQWYVYVPAWRVTWWVPEFLVMEFGGSGAGPVCHVTLWPLEGVAQVNVTWPAGTVFGVGLKKLLPTVIFVELPPLLVESLQAASTPTATTAAAKRGNVIGPPGWS